MQSSLEQIKGEEPSLQEMLEVLATIQGHRRAPLEQIQFQVRFLSNKINEMGQTRRLKLLTLRKKLQPLKSETIQALQAANSFLEQTQKSVNQSQKECMKKLDKLQRQRLQKDIEIGSSIDEKILEVAEQNENQEEFEQIQDMKGKVKLLKGEIEKWRTQRKKDFLNEKLRIAEQFKINRAASHKESVFIQNKTSKLKTRFETLKSNINKKLQQMSTNHQQNQRKLINQIQILVSKLM